MSIFILPLLLFFQNLNVETTIKEHSIDLEPILKNLEEFGEEKCTIVHCKFATKSSYNAIRIWLSTYLIEESNIRRKLIMAFNIPLMPETIYCKPVDGYCHFTLVFEGLSKDCISFHLLEDIPESGGFYTTIIERNKTDVYNVEVKCL